MPITMDVYASGSRNRQLPCPPSAVPVEAFTVTSHPVRFLAYAAVVRGREMLPPCIPATRWQSVSQIQGTETFPNIVATALVSSVRDGGKPRAVRPQHNPI
jgi:hypothetical protein